MKTFAQAAVIFMIVIVSVFVCFNLITANVTDTEAEFALSQSVEEALYVTLSGNSYSIQDKDTFLSDFTLNLLTEIRSGSNVDVRVLDVDEAEGLLDIEVTERLTYPDGKVREVFCRKTVIFEETVSLSANARLAVI